MDFAELKTAIDDHQVATTEVLQQTTKDLKATSGADRKLN